jgi:hypothetical protein
MIRPPQVGGHDNGVSFMELIRNAAHAAKSGMPTAEAYTRPLISSGHFGH